MNLAPPACVVDASALIDAVLDPGTLDRSTRILLAGSQTHAPHLVDAEVGSVLRRIVLRGELDPDVAVTRLAQAQALVDVRHPMIGRLSSAAWGLRDEITILRRDVRVPRRGPGPTSGYLGWTPGRSCPKALRNRSSDLARTWHRPPVDGLGAGDGR